MFNNKLSNWLATMSIGIIGAGLIYFSTLLWHDLQPVLYDVHLEKTEARAGDVAFLRFKYSRDVTPKSINVVTRWLVCEDGSSFNINALEHSRNTAWPNGKNQIAILAIKIPEKVKPNQLCHYWAPIAYDKYLLSTSIKKVPSSSDGIWILPPETGEH